MISGYRSMAKSRSIIAFLVSIGALRTVSLNSTKNRAIKWYQNLRSSELITWESKGCLTRWSKVKKFSSERSCSHSTLFVRNSKIWWRICGSWLNRKMKSKKSMLRLIICKRKKEKKNIRIFTMKSSTSSWKARLISSTTVYLRCSTCTRQMWKTTERNLRGNHSTMRLKIAKRRE